MEKLSSWNAFMTIRGWTNDQWNYIMCFISIQMFVVVHHAVLDTIDGEMLYIMAWIPFLTATSFALLYYSLVKAIWNKFRFVNSTLKKLTQSMDSYTENPDVEDRPVDTLQTLRLLYKDTCEVSHMVSKSFEIPSLLVMASALLFRHGLIKRESGLLFANVGWIVDCILDTYALHDDNFCIFNDEGGMIS